jgi:hypothetical protein
MPIGCKHHFCHTTHPTSDNPCSNNGLDNYASILVMSSSPAPVGAGGVLTASANEDAAHFFRS